MSKKSAIDKILIHNLAGGIPPHYGLSRFTVGETEKMINELDDEYGESFEFCDQGFTKFIFASYGSGKTHFVLQFRELLMKKGSGCASSYFELTHNEVGLDNMPSIIQKVFENLEFPKSEEEIFEILSKPSLANSVKGIRNAVKQWLSKKEFEIRGDNNDREPFINYVIGLKNEIKLGPIGTATSFTRAFEKLIDGIVYSNSKEIDDMHDFFNGNLNSEKCKQYDLRPINKTDSFDTLNELVRILKIFGFIGLLLIFDESEFQGVAKPGSKRVIILEQIRQIIDKINSGDIPSLILLFTIVNKNQILGTHGALTTRTKTEFSLENTTGMIVNLENSKQDEQIWEQELKNLSIKILKIYQSAYNFEFNQDFAKNTIINLCKIAIKYRITDLSTKREFIAFLIKILHKLQKNPERQISEEEIENLLNMDLPSEVQNSEEDYFEDKDKQ